MPLTIQKWPNEKARCVTILLSGSPRNGNISLQPRKFSLYSKATPSGYIRVTLRQRTQSNPPSHKTPMAVSLGPATSLRFNPYSTLRFLSFYPKSSPTILKTLTKPVALPPKFHPSVPICVEPRRRFFCSVVSEALHSSERTKPEKWSGEMGNKVGEFRKKLKIADIKGGPDEGLDLVGQTLVVMGWVRTIRVQSSVTFIEVITKWKEVQVILG